MGYRSDVVLAIGNEVKTALLIAPHMKPACLSLFNREYGISEKHQGFCDEIKYEKNRHVFVINSIKWYPDDPIVRELYDFMDWIEETLGTAGEDKSLYGFMRLGEDTEDIEDRGHPYDFDIWLSQRIDY